MRRAYSPYSSPRIVSTAVSLVWTAQPMQPPMLTMTGYGHFASICSTAFVAARR